MKIGTVPKITVGVISILALAFIGSRQLISPEEDSTQSAKALASTDEATSPSVAVTNAAREEKTAGSPLETEPEFSAKEMEQIERFFAELDAADVQSDEVQSADTDERGRIDSEVFDTDDEQSPEDVMNAFVEAYRNANLEALLPLVIGTARDGIRSTLLFLNGDIPEEIESGMVDYLPESMSEEDLNEGLASYKEILRELRTEMQAFLGRIEIVRSEYVGDEFHFQLRAPMPEIPELLDMSELPEMPEFELPEIPEHFDYFHKMRKQDGEWLIYE